MKRGHRLTDISGFGTEMAQRLATVSIATAEELLAHVLVEGEDLQRVLEVNSSDFERAVAVAETAVGPEYLRALESSLAEQDHGYGALPPTSEDFAQYAQRPRNGAAR